MACAIDFLATGVVILISIAIAAGIVFLLALIEILWTLFARRDDKVGAINHEDLDADDDSAHRPSSLLEHINAATRSAIMQSPFGPHAEKEAGLTAASGTAAAGVAAQDDPFNGPDASNYVRAETPSDALVGGLDGEEQSRPAYARYSFDGKGEGELALRTGQELEILDDGDTAYVPSFLARMYPHDTNHEPSAAGGTREIRVQDRKVSSQQPMCTELAIELFPLSLA